MPLHGGRTGGPIHKTCSDSRSEFSLTSRASVTFKTVAVTALMNFVPLLAGLANPANVTAAPGTKPSAIQLPVERVYVYDGVGPGETVTVTVAPLTIATAATPENSI